MKFNIKALTLSAVISCTVPLGLLFIWCAANQFGYEFVALFEKIHPSGGFAITASTGGAFTSKIPGILINVFYTAADTFIISFAFGALYNIFAAPREKKSKK